MANPPEVVPETMEAAEHHLPPGLEFIPSIAIHRYRSVMSHLKMRYSKSLCAILIACCRFADLKSMTGSQSRPRLPDNLSPTFSSFLTLVGGHKRQSLELVFLEDPP